MRRAVFALLLSCSSSSERAPVRDEAPAPAPSPTAPSATAPAGADARAPDGRPPDEMDEKMRHCPLALEGARSTLADIAGGVRFTITAPAAAVAEARRRAHHLVEFAARRHAPGTHGAFDGKGGGRMKNCPVVTHDVTISVAELPDGARVDVTTEADRVPWLRAESRARAAKFPFVGATLTVQGGT